LTYQHLCAETCDGMNELVGKNPKKRLCTMQNYINKRVRKLNKIKSTPALPLKPPTVRRKFSRGDPTRKVLKKIERFVFLRF